MTICIDNRKHEYRPLDRVTIHLEGGGVLAVYDGEGRKYYTCAAVPSISFAAGGSLGTHRIVREDEDGRALESVAIRLIAKTEIRDEGGMYGELLTMLHYTMVKWNEADSLLYKGRIYRYFVCWLRDHVHTLKGMKYFYPELKSAIEIYRETQREDGMIWDNIYPREGGKISGWDQRFDYDGFIQVSEDNRTEFKRIPVENDVEYLYLEGIYYTWKATGDDQWMKGMLDSAIRATGYTMTSPYRWSTKYQLLKRGFTIDTWDFQSAEDAAVTGDVMVIDKDKSRFGVMHGDNTGFAAGCRYLAEMLEYAGRQVEADRYYGLSRAIKERLDALAWNGGYYTHHVPEDPDVVRDLGVDLSEQLSLSNAYALNRGLTGEQAEAIIENYLSIRENMPAGSPGEWYTIYPPFERGFGGHSEKWQYMNGGVVTIVAGELAKGAFDYGYEEYGADILARVHALAKRHGGYLHCCFKGALPEPPNAAYQPLDLSGSANAAEGIPGWNGKAPQEYSELPSGSRTFEGIPFDIPDRGRTRGSGCVSLQDSDGEPSDAAVQVGGKAAALYFLHAVSGNQLAGCITLEYEDGTRHTQYVNPGKEVLHWWTPYEPNADYDLTRKLVIAWEGRNNLCKRVGVSLYGMSNPHPDKTIGRIVLSSARSGVAWSVFGITLSDSDVYLRPSDVSSGIPDNWGAGAVVYGLVEGLAGVTDTSTAFSDVRLSPRWPAAGVDGASVEITYPASDGYVAYRYAHDPAERSMRFELAGNAAQVNGHFMLPPHAKDVRALLVDGEPAPFELLHVGGTAYADAAIRLNGTATVRIDYTGTN